ncbi:MAG: DUF4350 domain-containing protein [Bacteroidota bacterium]
MKTGFFFLMAVLLTQAAFTQQVSDTLFHYRIRQPAYPSDGGPQVLIDEAHYNFHTLEGRFSPFARLLRQDGYRVEALTEKISSADVLRNTQILVISNPLNEVNTAGWFLPTPSAINPEEITAIQRWVENGGSLLLIADHMPFAGAAGDLARAFGFEFLNGFAMTSNNTGSASLFSRKAKNLTSNTVTDNGPEQEKITKILSFTGSAFKIPGTAVPVMSFTDKDYSLQPDTAWQFNDQTPSVKLDGYHQGAILDYGKGRVAVFGEAAMFTAQIADGRYKVGMNSEKPNQNAQFILNLLHWLDPKRD